MERFHYNRKYDKNNIVTYRGESDNTGSNPAFYGLGLYTTLDSKYAKKYGNVFVVDNSLLPDNPLKFKTQNDFNIWEQELARELGIRKSELYSDDYGVEQYIKKLGYDGLMIGTGKDTDLISYKDVAIKYSQQNDKWQEHLENNYKATGTRTDMKSLELPTVNKETKVTNKTDVLPKYNSNSVLKEENKLSSKKIIKDKINKTIQNQSYKAVNTATKVGQSYLEFDRAQKSEFKSKLSQYIGKTRNELTNAKTWTEIKNLVNDYSNKEITYVDQELKNIKSEIRNSNIKVSQELKQQISDYNEFRKSNFGKLKLSLTGTSIDSFYQELSEQYPHYFGKSLTEVDMLHELSEFMNQDVNITQKFKIDDDTLNRATTKIYNSLIQNTLNSSEIQEMQGKLEAKMEARTRSVIQEELLEDKEKYGDDRKTQILPEQGEVTIEDLTPNTPMAVFITHQGYLKRISLDTFERQNRATRGKSGIKTKEDDDIQHFFTAMMHDKVLFFSSKGTVYSLNVYDFPEGGRQAKGLPIVNVLPIDQDERITAVVPVSQFSHELNLIMLTKKGYIKRIELDNFVNIRRNGIIAIGLEENDELNWVKLATARDEIIIGTSCGMAIRFPIEDLRPLGRSARGVTSMKLRSGDEIVGCDIVPRDYDADLLVVTSDGFGKRTKLSEFRSQNRGGIGLIATKFKSTSSKLVALTIVKESDDIMMVTANGVVTRLNAGSISRQGRPATGVRAQNLTENDTVVSVNKILNPDEDEQVKKDVAAMDAQDAQNNVAQTSLLDNNNSEE